MKPDISATEAVRHFSELLNNIKYRGHRYTIFREGKPVAALVPVDKTGSSRHLSDLKTIFETLPRLGPTDSSFADDVLEAVRAHPPIFPFDTTVASIYARIWASLAKPEDLLSIPAAAEWPLWLRMSPGAHIAPYHRS